MKRSLPLLIVIVVALAASAGAFLLYQEMKPAVLTSTGNAAEPAAAEPHARGPKTARVTLEEFADFQCPPCGKLSLLLKGMLNEFPGDLRVVFRHFPLRGHQHAKEAAAATEAAGLQGKFWEMHDLLYREQALWSRQPEVGALFENYAGQLGLDLEKFREDRASAAVLERVAADQKYGTGLGVNSTPTVFVNGQQVPAKGLNTESVRRAIRAALTPTP